MPKYIFETRIEVRDYECDIEGIVNNANYLHYMEHTRHLFLRHAGLSFADMHAKGVDAVVAEGAESGGHVGELHTMPLIPQIVDALDIPVVAAGGICDGRGAAAAFMLGADAIQVGTRFLSAEECTAHEEYKQKILKATDISTIVTGKTLGHPVRSLKTPFSKSFAKMEADPDVTPEQILSFGTGALRKAVKEGDRNGSYMAGECAGMVKNIEPAKVIVEDLILGAEKIIREAYSNLLA